MRRAAAEAVEGDPPAAEPRGALLSKLLPELTVAGAALAVAVAPDRVPHAVRDAVQLVALLELLLCLGQGTLTDIATRLRRRPPWWAALPVAGLVVWVSPEVLPLTRAMFAQGWPVFLPFLWSLLERLRELWTMPTASRLEKMRRRALVGGRIALVLIGGGLATAVAGISYLIDEQLGFTWVASHAAWGVAAFFFAAAADVVRVHRPAFARRPRALVPGLDPLGVTYLEPLL